MHNVKKLMFALPFVAGVSWAGTTLYTGSQTRDAYDQLITQLDQMSGLTVSNETYSAGFMKSLAVTQVRTSEAPDAQVLLRLQHEIHHSPVGVGDGSPRVGAARIETRLLTDQMSADWQQALAKFDHGEAFLLTSDVDFAGNTGNALVVNGLHTNDDEIELGFEGATLNFDNEVDGRFSGMGTIGQLLLSSPDGMRLQMEPGTTEADLQWVGNGIYTGTQSISFPRFELADSSGQTLGSIEEVSLSADMKVNDDALDSGTTFKVAAIDSPLPLNSGSLQVNIDGLSLRGLEAYQEVTNELVLTNPDALDDDAIVIRILDAMKQVIAPGAGMTYTLALNNDGGDADAKLALKFKGDGSATGRETIATVGDLLRAMTGSLTVRADADALALTPAPMLLASSPALSAYVIDDGVSYRTEMDVADLIVNINGEPLSLEQMLGGVLAMPLNMAMLSDQ